MTWSIQVEHLSKRYKIGRGHRQKFDSLYQVFSDGLISLADKATFGKAMKYLPARIEAPPIEIQSEHLVLSSSQFEGAPDSEFWALRDVSFRIDEGQRVGIIGRNGSGKSTLLKILSRITAPTEGKYSYRGRLISLLEVGTGFHPDLSGRENIYLNAKINGMSDKEIRRSFDAIVDFSELGAQIDTPIKRYSSGMYMRLAFSVAAHLESEILIVDEVLAVGDAGFQKKCMDKMLAIGNSGRTLLFVSHDMDAVKKICTVALELSHGRIVSRSDLLQEEINTNRDEELSVGTGLKSVSAAIKDYSLGGVGHKERVWSINDAPQFPAKRAVLRRVSMHHSDESADTRFTTDEEIQIHLEVLQYIAAGGFSIRVNISSETGKMLLTSHEEFNSSVSTIEQKMVLSCLIPGGLFNPGVYRVSLCLSSGLPHSQEVCVVPDVIDFEVIQNSKINNKTDITVEAALNFRFNWTLNEGKKSSDKFAVSSNYG